MPHPVYGRPVHQLEAVELRLVLPSKLNAYHTTLTIHGRSSGSRSNLWVARERWDREEVNGAFSATDAAHHALLVAAQDRPNSQASWDRAMLGPGWEEVPLPF